MPEQTYPPFHYREALTFQAQYNWNDLKSKKNFNHEEIIAKKGVVFWENSL